MQATSLNSFHAQKFLTVLIFSLSLLLSALPIDAQNVNSELINNNLDNSSVREVYEDTALLRGRGIFSVKSYRLADPKKKLEAIEIIDGKKFTIKSYTEYLPDGRKLYKKYPYDNGERVEQFYYDSEFKKLLLYHLNENKKVLNYHWLFYDEANILKEDYHYRIYGNNEFDYEGYTRYVKSETPGNLTIRVQDYGYDSLANPEEAYIFENNMLKKLTPQYQYREQLFEKRSGKFYGKEFKNYGANGRVVTFQYDENNFPVSEIWTQNGKLENKTEYEYNSNYTERVEQNYHMRGTEKSTRRIRKYNEWGDIIFEQSIEYTGNPLSITTLEYKYDSNRNWVERKKFFQPVEQGVPGRRELTDHEIRQIVYYQPNQKPSVLKPPDFPAKAAEISTAIPTIAIQKQKEIDAFNNAVETGNYDKKIVKKNADLIEDFTPEFWKVREVALGDLDGNAGDEAAVVYQTPISNDVGFAHMLAIYKKEKDGWSLWHQTSSPLLGTADGGMMGNPFDGISIERRCIVIHHWGGSRQKWSYTHRYRFQNNNWYAIGAAMNFGSPCDYFIDLDYNMVTGDVVAGKSVETCDENDERKEESWEEKFRLKRPLILMDKFTPGGNSIKLKKHNEEFYY